MGERGLEGRGRRPQRKGCLLLAVAGVTSLVTLLLAVPITVVAVLALVPQEQGGLVSGYNKPSTSQVTGTADPGIQAPAHQRFESGELPEEDSETDLSPRLPAAHLIGKDPISLIRIPSHCVLASCFPAPLPGGGKTRPGSPHLSTPHRTPRCRQSQLVLITGERHQPAPRPSWLLQGVKSPRCPPCPPSQKPPAWITPFRI
ncbi:lymphotoxin-beta isoform 5-T5 [Dama dama]|uniref:lymphotoxin-beta isoform X3 n=1 Tax=Dama dama TaxID=30532 RepID=UPI002A359A0B|nr:lymphotoxin-beta isoform X3 [Dama dama]